MENEREDKIRRRALEMWEMAGQRGVHQDYWDAAAREIDAEFEEQSRRPEQPAVPLIP